MPGKYSKGVLEKIEVVIYCLEAGHLDKQCVLPRHFQHIGRAAPSRNLRLAGIVFC